MVGTKPPLLAINQLLGVFTCFGLEEPARLFTMVPFGALLGIPMRSFAIYFFTRGHFQAHILKRAQNYLCHWMTVLCMQCMGTILLGAHPAMPIQLYMWGFLSFNCTVVLHCATSMYIVWCQPPTPLPVVAMLAVVHHPHIIISLPNALTCRIWYKT